MRIRKVKLYHSLRGDIIKPSSISKTVVDVMLIKVKNNVLGTEAHKLE